MTLAAVTPLPADEADAESEDFTLTHTPTAMSEADPVTWVVNVVEPE